MKATGIVRRIDDLGRIVIPREIRKQMRIKEGDPLEIFTDFTRREVIFRPYAVNPSVFGEIEKLLLMSEFPFGVLITVRDEVVFIYKSHADFMGRMSSSLYEKIQNTPCGECKIPFKSLSSSEIHYKKEIGGNSDNCILVSNQVPSEQQIYILDIVERYIINDLEF